MNKNYGKCSHCKCFNELDENNWCGICIPKQEDYEIIYGKEIEKLILEESGKYLDLILSDGTTARFKTEADCCSYTWIESIDNETITGKILSIEDIEMPDLGNSPGKRHEDVDMVQYYGLKIITDKGYCVIDYRNDSNGYYGGNVRLIWPCRRGEIK